MFNFTLQQINSPFDDSAFFVRNVYKKRAFMFDCGRLGRIDNSDLLSVSDIFVSHTHIDHFVGFDRIIRGGLRSENTIKVYGPPGFIRNVDGKFRSYTWNLIGGYTFTIEAIELHPNHHHKVAKFCAGNAFEPEYSEFQADIIDLGEGFTLEYEFFEHRTISVGYRVSEPLHISIDKEKLQQGGYKSGAWLGELKDAIESNQFDKTIAVTKAESQQIISVQDLTSELVYYKKPQVITYITDCSPSDENISKAIKFANGSKLLVIEAVFTDEDIEHAIEKNHLTVGIAKKIYNESKSEFVRFTHFASRYEIDKQSFFNKLYEGFNGLVYSTSNNS